jgi:hypothetical protein
MDFSATMDLHACETKCSATDGHAVLAIFIILHSPQEVNILDENGKIIGTKHVHDCDVWHFFDETISKGKKNDHMFHNACLEEIVNYYL